MGFILIYLIFKMILRANTFYFLQTSYSSLKENTVKQARHLFKKVEQKINIYLLLLI